MEYACGNGGGPANVGNGGGPVRAQAAGWPAARPDAVVAAIE